MSIERGKDWGETGRVPADAHYVRSDAEASGVIGAARRANEPLPPVALLGGDLARTLGARCDEAALRHGEATHVRVDLGAALVDGRLHWFVAHLVARRGWLVGRLVVAANAAFLGPWNIAPRAHPGDGRLDLLDADLSLSDRWKARRRLPTGTHVPHPDITVRRVEAVQVDLERPTPVFLDGRRVGRARSLSIRVEPDAVDVWI